MEEIVMLSIIVPIYNVEKYLERCVDSLLKQDILQDKYEIILVNDGSIDLSGCIAEKYAKEHINVKYYIRENGGLSAARNTGMQYAKGKYIMFVDSDDYLESNILSKLLELSESNKLDLCFFETRKEYADGKTELIDVQKLDDKRIYDGISALRLGMSISTVWHNVYLHSFLKDVNISFTEGIFHEDIDFNMRLYPFAKRILFTHILGYHYSYYGESITRTQSVEKRQKQLYGNLTVAYNVLNFIKKNPLPKDILNLYQKQMNSLLFSLILQSLSPKYGIIGINVINAMQNMDLYPIKGKTNSKSSYIAKIILNKKWIVCLLVKVRVLFIRFSIH